jgi:hypothetical protein
MLGGDKVNKIVSETMLYSDRKNDRGAEKPKAKDCWDKLDVIAKALIPIALLAGGYFLNSRLNIISQRQSNIRTALELQNGRESAETELRGSMFAKILERYSKSGGSENIGTQLLYLELLVSNFNQSLDLSPMLKEVKRNIDALPASREREKMLRRLAAVISEAQARQLTTIATDGAVQSITLDKDDHGSKNLVILSCEKGVDMPRRIPIRITLVSNSDDSTALIQITQFIREGPKRLKAETTISVDENDLPLIDSMRIAPGLRMSVLMTGVGFDPTHSDAKNNPTMVSVLVFPDEVASLKDRPRITDYLESLNQDVQINPETKPSTDNQCQTLARRVSFSVPTDYDYADIPISD